MRDEELNSILDQEFGPEVTPGIEQQVEVPESTPGKSSQNIIPWVEIQTHSSEDAESLMSKLKGASINYPDLKFKISGKNIIAQIQPIRVEIPYMNGIIKVASEHGVTNIAKRFQVVDAK